MKLPKEIEAYRPEAEAIIGWLSDGWLDQDKFDVLSWAHEQSPKSLRSFTPETLLEPMLGGLYIMLVQSLMKAGMVEAREAENGKIEYKLKQN